MSDKEFRSNKGLIIANNVIATNGANVGIGNTAAIHTLSVNGDTFIQTSLVINTALTANSTGLYHTGVINAASISIGTALTANTTRFVIANTVGVSANGSLGSNGQILYTTGTTVYWANAASVSVVGGSSNTQILFNDSGTSNGSSLATIDKATSTVAISGTLDDCSANTKVQTLTDDATVNWNAASGRIATLTLAGTGRTMAAPTNLKTGVYILHVKQDATGSRTITSWNSVFKWPADVAPTLSTAANSRDVFSFICDGTNLYGTYILGFTS